jgi:streptogramin lyase
MNELGGYDWGAPLIVTPRTRIAEYEVPRPNAVREAVVRGSGRERSLYVADVSSNTMFRINVETGAQSTLQIPHAAPFGPHSLHKAADGSLWATPFFPTALSHLDVKTQQWRTWPLKARSGEMSGIHDLSFTFDHVVRTDEAGRVWFSDIVNTGVGYLDPKNGQLEIYRAPPTPGRSPSGQLYGLAMTPDRKELWYTQLAIGQFGSFNIASKQFEVSVVLPANSGPRRMTISDQVFSTCRCLARASWSSTTRDRANWWARTICPTAPAPHTRRPGIRCARSCGFRPPMPMPSIASIRATRVSAYCRCHGRTRTCA